MIWLGTTRPPGGGGGGDPIPTVRLVTPAAGEQLVGGKQAAISWSATAIKRVQSFDVLLSTDGGVSFPTSIASGLPAGQTSFSWTVPMTCAANARLEVVAYTTDGQQIKSPPGETFSIVQTGPEIDLSKSSVDAESLLLTAGSGSLFAGDIVIEISSDESGSVFATFSKQPKVKNGGKKLKTRGTIAEHNVGEFFPDGAVRVIRVTVGTCNTTKLKVRRNGNQLIAADTSMKFSER